MLQDRLNDDLKQAMRDKNELKTSTIRMLKAAVMNASIEKKKDALSDDEVLDVISKQIKQRKDSIDSFTKGNRPELADKESRELGILQSYLPPQLSDADLKKLVQEAIASVGAQSKKDMGRVMKDLMPKVKGKADSQAVNQMVNSLLP